MGLNSLKNEIFSLLLIGFGCDFSVGLAWHLAEAI